MFVIIIIYYKSNFIYNISKTDSWGRSLHDILWGMLNNVTAYGQRPEKSFINIHFLVQPENLYPEICEWLYYKLLKHCSITE